MPISSDPGLKQVSSRLVSDTGQSEHPERIRDIVSGLRTRYFGQRKHVFVELLLDTKSRPEQVRNIDCSDLDLTEGRVRIGIPETHLVRRLGLVTEREVDLSGSTLTALQDYLQYDRNETNPGAERPVFTTPHGRVSGAALRRSIKGISETMVGSTHSEIRENGGPKTRQTDESQPLAVLPEDIWRYSISRILEDQ